MDATELTKIVQKVKRNARSTEVLTLVEAVEAHLAEGCAECRRRREETAARVQRHRTRKGKGKVKK
jgi:hypothetical protein